MIKLPIQVIARIVGIADGTFSNRVITNLLTDSRSLGDPTGVLFIALTTPSNDGHRYVSRMLAAGVRSFVVNRIPEDLTAGQLHSADFLIVNDTLSALQAIGRYCRTLIADTVMAVTGSRGKTVVKEWIYTLAAPYINIWRSPRSYNSQTGVPLSLWQADVTADASVFEAGISQSGEMRQLADMLRPRIGVLTNVGDEHEQGFESLQQKAEQKLLLFKDCQCLIYNCDDSIVNDAVCQAGLSKRALRISFFNPDADFYVYSLDGSTISLKCGKNKITFDTGFTNRYDIENLLTSLAAVNVLGVKLADAVKMIPALTPVYTRMTVVDGINSSVIINDPMTTDLASLLPALDFAGQRRTDGRPFILVAGQDAAKINGRYDVETLFGILRHRNVSLLVGIGSVYKDYERLESNVRCVDSVADLLKSLPDIVSPGAVILVSGMHNKDAACIIEHLEARNHETVLEVSLNALAHNFNSFKSLIPSTTGIICMVKASGYGTGAEETAKTLQAQGAAYVAVAVCDEGMALRRAGVTMPIMVMNPRSDNYFAMFGARLEPEIYSFELLDDIIAAAVRSGQHRYPLHIKIDTGMHRLGFLPEELPQVADRINASSAVCCSSVFSHLATADCPDQDDYTESQLELFDSASTDFVARFNYPVHRHLLNSAGIIRFGRTKYSYDMVRLGISLYGIDTVPMPQGIALKPVSSLLTSVIALRERAAGTTVGYGRKGRLHRDSVIATLPVGYADGLNRHLGNGRLSVSVNGHRCPVVGNICMDACMIDVTGVPCKVGDRVELFGTTVTPAEIAVLLDTIPYEVLTSVSERVRRVYFRD